MTDYDIEKVSPRPWTAKHDFGNEIRNARNDNILTIHFRNAVHPINSTDLFHIVHCVNEHDALVADRARLEFLAKSPYEFQLFNGGWQYGHMVYEDFIADCDSTEYFATFREAIDTATKETSDEV